MYARVKSTLRELLRLTYSRNVNSLTPVDTGIIPKQEMREMSAAVTAHFVEFLSPGTFFAESTIKPIASWDVDLAKAMALEIVERYAARPYGFRFLTRERSETDLDSKVAARSGTYFLGGHIETVDEVRTRADPNERTLLWNMEANGYDRVVVNTNSWKWTQTLRGGDEVLDFEMPASAPSAA